MKLFFRIIGKDKLELMDLYEFHQIFVLVLTYMAGANELIDCSKIVSNPTLPSFVRAKALIKASSCIAAIILGSIARFTYEKKLERKCQISSERKYQISSFSCGLIYLVAGGNMGIYLTIMLSFIKRRGVF